MSLSPKAFRLLEILVEQQPKAMAKAALQDLFCSHTFVVGDGPQRLEQYLRTFVKVPSGFSRRSVVNTARLCRFA